MAAKAPFISKSGRGVIGKAGSKGAADSERTAATGAARKTEARDGGGSKAGCGSGAAGQGTAGMLCKHASKNGEGSKTGISSKESGAGTACGSADGGAEAEESAAPGRPAGGTDKRRRGGRRRKERRLRRRRLVLIARRACGSADGGAEAGELQPPVGGRNRLGTQVPTWSMLLQGSARRETRGRTGGKARAG